MDDVLMYVNVRESGKKTKRNGLTTGEWSDC